tara:strand:+ start:150 stop:479 length:330 start_codon:yes stop_codon:yes gene_type:complete
MANSKFKVGQIVSFTASTRIGNKMRKGGTITKVERMYELKDEYKRYYSNGECRGEMTTDKDLSKRKFKGYAYIIKTIQPKGFYGEIVAAEEDNLTPSTEKQVVESYTYR